MDQEISKSFDAWRAEDIKQHVRSRIADADLKLAPYPYFIVHDLMPDDFYARAQWFCDNGTAYAYPIPNGNGEARFPATRSFNNAPDLSNDAKLFWTFFRETVCAAVNEASIEKLKAEIKEYVSWLKSRGFVNRSAEVKFTDSALQVFQRNISSVGAHHHSLYELVTNLIYMPRDASMKETGTQIDRLNGYIDVKFGRVFGLSKTKPYFFHDRASRLMTYDIVPRFMEKGEATAQYLPNTLLTILNSPRALHSQRVAHEGKPRNLLLFASLIERDQWTTKYRDTRGGGFELYADQLV
jgi:hypothetical protein